MQGQAPTTALPATNATRGTRTAPAPIQDVFIDKSGIIAGPAATYTAAPEPAPPCTATATAHPWQPDSRQAPASSGDRTHWDATAATAIRRPMRTTRPKTNSHASHNFGCGTCHAGTTADGVTISNKSLHVNGAYNVTPGAGTTFTYTYAATGGTCSNISCHGNTSATWGSGVLPQVDHNATSAYGDVLVFSNDTQDHPAGTTILMACTVCHYGDLVTQHNGNCALCHVGTNPPASALIGNWNRTCQQASCHPTIHASMGSNHNGVYSDSSSSCSNCHDDSSAIPRTGR